MLNKNKDLFWIDEVLKLAKKGIGKVSPNPLVGCIIVKNEKIVGQGYHQKQGEPHAEINALKQAGIKAKGASLYTNLEPCCHWGKTPPCTESIIRAGIKEVISAIEDPNPLVKGQGFKKLKQAKINVRFGIHSEKAININKSFIKYITQKKPYVILKSAISLDGKISTQNGSSQWITSLKARRFGHQLRSETDAILVGAETIRKDNPTLSSHGKGKNPIKMIFTTNGKISTQAHIFNSESKTFIFHTKEINPNHSKKYFNSEWFDLSKSHKKKVASNLLTLCAENKISKILIEGGGETSAFFLENNEVDEVYFFIAPLLIGGKTAKTAFEGLGFKSIQQSISLLNPSTQWIGPDLLYNARLKPLQK